MAQNPNRDINESINEDKNGREMLVKADHVKVYFEGKDKKPRTTKAVDDISFHIMKGEVFGVVGESGCGKSVLGRVLVRLLKPVEGHIYMGGTDIIGLKGADLKKMRREVQTILQGPSTCLDPRRVVRQIPTEPSKIHGMEGKMGAEIRVMKFLSPMGLDLYCLNRYPHGSLGRQKQCIDITRALTLESSTITCDEAVPALDVLVQAQVLNLLQELREKLGLTYFFTSHDLNVIYQVSDRVRVMYFSSIVEVADYGKLYEKRYHSYMKTLLSAIPQVDQGVKTERICLRGEVPSPSDPSSDCRFHTRCSKAYDRYRQKVSRLGEMTERHSVACHLYRGFTGLRILV